MLDPKIYTLLKVAETGNYTQAGKEQNITQPAVSQHIRALEREFDIKIFERLGNQLILTKEGESVVACARSMISLYNNLRTSLKDEAAGMMSLKIGVTHTVESNRLSEVFAKYASTGKGINIKLLTGTQAKLIQRLKNFSDRRQDQRAGTEKYAAGYGQSDSGDFHRPSAGKKEHGIDR